MRKVALGRTGIEASYLSIGTGTGGWNGVSNQTRLGFDTCVDMIRYAYDRGVSFIDTADQYGSHAHVAEAVDAIGADNVVICTKTCAADSASIAADVPRYLRELRVERLDIVLMHCMTSADWRTARRPVMDAMAEYKHRGVIGAVGVSCHDFGAMRAAAEEPWVDLILARINHDGVHLDASPDEVRRLLQRMHDDGKAVYGMKVVGQGRLAEDYASCIEYVHGLDCVDAITIGMESRQQVDANVACIEALDRGETPPAAATLTGGDGVSGRAPA